MTKAYSKAAKRKARKAQSSSVLPKKKSRGRARMREIERENLQSNLEARARQLGADDPSAMRFPMLSEPAGQALHLSCDPQEAKDLWDTYTKLTAAEARFHRSLGLSVYPKMARAEFVHESLEVRADVTFDPRSEEERDAAAKDRWDYWDDLLKQIDRSAIFSASRGFGEMVKDAQVTLTGKRFVVAMRELQEIM